MQAAAKSATAATRIVVIVPASSCDDSPSSQPRPPSRYAIAQKETAASLPLPAKRDPRRKSAAVARTAPMKITTAADSIRKAANAPKETVCTAIVTRKKISTVQALESSGRDSG